jgi:hypothetical protein
MRDERTGPLRKRRNLMATKKARKELNRAKKIEARKPLSVPATHATSRVTHGDFSVVKYVDNASPK